MRQLTSADREFFSKIYDSARLNPFGTERQASDAAAVGAKMRPTPFAHLYELLLKLTKRLDAVLGGGVPFSSYAVGDARLIETAVLFLVFHRHSKALDVYIREQSRAGGAPLPADCGAAIFADLKARGFTTARAERCVAVFFQLRRAYIFIHSGLIGDCESMRRLRVDLWNAIFTCDMRLYLDAFWNRMEGFSTLLLGETGTGKGAAALAIGRSCYIPYISQRRAFAENFADALLSINLSEFSESLIESELFGHVKGSFTGAIGDHDGIFSRCSGHGAIFLDEIGDVSEHVQIKLLKVLQERAFSPVGGYRKLRFSGRLIAATNQNLALRRAEGSFRNDFYYRLSSSRIILPPLRQRIAENRGELGLLLAEIVRRLAGSGDGELVTRIEEAIARGLPPDYPWPGNVRELEQAARSIILTGSYGPEDGAALPPQGANDGKASAGIGRILDGSLSLEELESWYCERLYKRLGTYGDVAKRLGIDWRTVKDKIKNATPSANE